MITQAITRWVRRLFAWWPWRGAPEASYAQVGNNLKKGTTQESTTRATVDGPTITSVVVEQSWERTLPDTHPELHGQLLPSTEEQATLRASSTVVPQHIVTSNGDKLSPSEEQRLAFLQYLFRRGHINEGFEGEGLPDQYKK